MKKEDYHLAPRQWINNDHKQLEWVRKYLKKDETDAQRMFTPNALDSYEGIINELEFKLMSPEGMVDLAKMKAAWSQVKYRSKLKNNDKQSYNFVLNTNIKQQLKVLAKQINKPMNEVLEDLISSTYEQVLAEKNTRQGKKNDHESVPAIHKHWPYYFDGINYYWSNGSPRGPIGGEAYNSDKSPYFFNGTHFFWYNGLPRKPNRDELNRLRTIEQAPFPMPPRHSTQRATDLSSPIQPTWQNALNQHNFAHSASSPEIYNSVDKLPSHVRGYSLWYMHPFSTPQPNVQADSMPHDYLANIRHLIQNTVGYSPPNYSAGTNPFSPLTSGRPYLPIEKTIGTYATPQHQPQPQHQVITRGDLIMQQGEHQYQMSKMYHAFGINNFSK